MPLSTHRLFGLEIRMPLTQPRWGLQVGASPEEQLLLLLPHAGNTLALQKLRRWLQSG